MRRLSQHVSDEDVRAHAECLAERVGGAGRDRPESRSAASERPNARRPPQAVGLETVEKVLIQAVPLLR